ncbi:protein Iojap, chloroplastic-like isoform X2 [Tasmannia lanceolata]|uniref:protein Iojap, chloroplastic-like isoform X2 n=1 Tax=Tasmannia lanceolata TaxID=3420 RepID=UPI0040634354
MASLPFRHPTPSILFNHKVNVPLLLPLDLKQLSRFTNSCLPQPNNPLHRQRGKNIRPIKAPLETFPFRLFEPPQVEDSPSELEPADPDFDRIGYVRSVQAYGVEFKEGPNGFGLFASRDVEPLRRARNVNGDTDEMFDDLFDKYGKVVFRRNDQKPPSAEADDDAESLSFAVALAKVASEVKAADIRVLFVKPLVYWTRFFIIATAFSRPQVDAMGSKIRDIAEKQFEKVATGDTKPNSWTLLDFGDVVVHIFLPEQRAFYNLEEFYGNATLIELPFDTQTGFRK